MCAQSSLLMVPLLVHSSLGMVRFCESLQRTNDAAGRPGSAERSYVA
jgi:hypothetical protein